MLYFGNHAFPYLYFYFSLLLFTWSMRMRKMSYHEIQKEVLSFYHLCALVCSWVHSWDTINSPKAISPFLTTEHVHTWLALLKDMGPKGDHLDFSLRAVDALLKSLPSQTIASFLSHGSWRGHSPHRCPRRVGPDPKTVPHASSSQKTSGRS